MMRFDQYIWCQLVAKFIRCMPMTILVVTEWRSLEYVGCQRSVNFYYFVLGFSSHDITIIHVLYYTVRVFAKIIITISTDGLKLVCSGSSTVAIGYFCLFILLRVKICLGNFNTKQTIKTRTRSHPSGFLVRVRESLCLTPLTKLNE